MKSLVGAPSPGTEKLREGSLSALMSCSHLGWLGDAAAEDLGALPVAWFRVRRLLPRTAERGAELAALVAANHVSLLYPDPAAYTALQGNYAVIFQIKLFHNFRYSAA